jgi:MoaA/NifB/PqqE/SkfB family radical SAM enzyme
LNSPEILPFVSIDEAMMFFQPDELKTYIWWEQICWAWNRSIHIDGVWRVSPCVYMWKDYQQWRILKDWGLLDFWKWNVWSAFTKIRNLQEPEECKSCDKLCKYECPAIRSYLSNWDTTW